MLTVLSRVIARLLGWLWYHVVPVRRSEALTAVAQAFPEKAAAEHRRIVKASFVHQIHARFGGDGFVAPGFVAGGNRQKEAGVLIEFLGEIARITPATAQPGGDPNPRVAVLADAWRACRRTEERIRANPEQWVWSHRTWKATPQAGDRVRTARGLEVFGKGRVGVLFDRDGTLNRELGRTVLSPDELELLPGVGLALRRLNDAGIAVFVVTNQAAVARGRITEAELDAIHRRMREQLAKDGARIDGILYCPHHPTEGKGAYLRTCDCRKPLPGLLNRATAEGGLNPQVSLFVGDRDTDVRAARAAGYPVTLVSNGWAHKPWEPPTETADHIAENLPHAIDRFLETRFGERGE